MTKIKIFNRRLDALPLNYILVYLIIFLLVCLVLVLIISVIDNYMIMIIGVILFISIWPTCMMIFYFQRRHFKRVCKRFNLTPEVPLHPAMILAPPALLLASYFPCSGEYKGFKLLYDHPTGEGPPWKVTVVLGKETPDLEIFPKKGRISGFFKPKNEVKTLHPEFDEKLTALSKDPKFTSEILDSDIRDKILKLKKPHITIKKTEYGNSVIYTGSHTEPDLDYIEKVVKTLADIADKIRDMNRR